MQNAQDKAEILEVVQHWALWRDTGNWGPLRTVYAKNGRMSTMWFDGTADDFIAACKPAFGKGNSGHFMCGTAVSVNGGKAIANSRLTLVMRAKIDEVAVDMTCYGRFIDRFIKEDGRWCIAHRNTIYDKDCLVPVVPGVLPKLDHAELQSYPEGYRYLAYLQKRAGRGLTPDTPTWGSETLARLYRDNEAWLAAG